MQTDEKKVGLVLSGGGARGAAHIGVLQALNENGIYPNHIAGSSAGALVGALYCSGFSPLEILELSKSHSFLKIFKIGFINKGLTEMTRLKSFLNNLIDDDFRKLKTPLSISVTNLNTGNFEIISDGKLIDYITASCAVPLLFKPIYINGSSYVDGGLLNNLPIEPLILTCDKIIGISVDTHQFREEIKGVMQIAQRCMQLAIWNTVQDRIKKCDLAIEIEKSFTYSMFSINKSNDLYNIGYEATLERIDDILKTINS